MKHVFHITMPLLAMMLLASGKQVSAQTDGLFSLSTHPDFVASNDTGDSQEAVKQVVAGDLCLTRNEPQKAIEHYKKAAEAWPYAGVYIGLGKAYVTLGDYDQAVAAYRTAFEGSTLKARGGDNNPEVLMHYALALSKTGNDAKALDVCRRGLQLLSADGSQRFAVPLPDIGNERINRLVSRKRLQAIAHVGIALSGSGFVAPKEWQVDHARAAAETQPDADWTHYYYGRALANHDGKKAKDELAIAARLGDSSTKKAVEDFLKDRPAIGLK